MSEPAVKQECDELRVQHVRYVRVQQPIVCVDNYEHVRYEAVRCDDAVEAVAEHCGGAGKLRMSISIWG